MMRRAWLWGSSVTLAVAVLIGGCRGSDSRPSDPRRSQEAEIADLDRQAYEATISRLETEIRDLHAERVRLLESLGGPGTDRESQEADLETCRRNLQRYQAGLQRAVAALNACGSADASAAPTAHPATPPRSAPGPRRISSRIGPDVRLLPDSIEVRGELWSYEAEEILINLDLDLLEDGKVIASTTLKESIPSYTDVAYSYTFPNWPREGAQYTARVRIRE
jgi:hypothetical protein